MFSVEHAQLSQGEVLAGRYRVVQLLGEGGMGAVYLAEHIELGRTVALKVMLNAVSSNADLVNRFVNEARAAASIGHPGIVEVFDLGVHEGRAFIAMEKLDGEELEARIKRGPMPLDEVVRLASELTDAIAAAHERGIVHRDLKPANVFLARRGRYRAVKVLDFGIAKLTHGDSRANTKTGAVFGTPLYMPPEQLQDAKKVDVRADVYSIGAVIFAALAGQPPFDATTLANLFYKIVSEPPPSLRTLRPDTPVWLEQIVLKALAKSPKDRFANAGEMLAAIDAQTDGAPVEPAAFAGNERPSPGAAVGSFGGSAAALTPLFSTRPPAPRRLGGWIAGAVVTTLVIGAAITTIVLRSASGVSPSATSEALAAPSGTPPATASAPAPVPSVELSSEPVGAKVYAGDRKLCDATPCSVAVEGPLRVELKKEGYAPLTVDMDSSSAGSKVTRELTPLPAASAPKPPSKVRKPAHNKPSAPPATPKPPATTGSSPPALVPR